MDLEGARDPATTNRFVDAGKAATVPREKARIESVRRISVALGHADQSLFRITRLLSHALSHPAATMVLFGEDSAEPTCSYGMTEPETAAIAGFAFWREAVSGNKIIVVGDTAGDPRFPVDGETGKPHWRSFAVAPIRAPNGLSVGGMAVLDREPRQLTLQEELLLRDFRDTAEELIRLRSELLDDPDTEVWARHYLESMLRKQWSTTYTHLRPLTLMRIRVTPVRDADCRRSIALFLQESFRRSCDIVGGFADNEFVALLPETNREGAEALGRWLCTSLADMIDDSSGQISVGAATVFADAEFAAGPDNLLRRAEAALTRAAGEPGNRFVSWAESAG